jgi:hypothetical protein
MLFNRIALAERPIACGHGGRLAVKMESADFNRSLLTTMSEDFFQQLPQVLASSGAEQVLTSLADHFRAEQKYHELFDVLLMRDRLRLGLPLAMSTSIDEVPEPTRTQLEEAYLAACRDVGTRLLAEKRVREAWPYLRPIGDRALVAEGLAAIEPDDDNLQALVEILLHEGIDVGRGYQLVLDHYGTCNAISAFEGVVMAKSKSEQRDAAARLVRRMRQELLANLRADIEQRESKPPAETSLRDLVANRPELFEGNNYHIDVTHLASTIRYARLLEDAEELRLALDLAEYGRRLSTQFQSAGEEPFVGTYPRSALFFAAQLGEQVDEALDYFRQRAEQVDAYHEGTLAGEVYVVLLARLGRYTEAIDAAAKMIPPGTHTTGFAPTLMELCRQAGDYTRLMEVCRERGDLVGYAVGLISA